MKNIKEILKKRVLTIAAVVLLVVGSVSVYAGINSQSADMGMDPLEEGVAEPNQVLLSGKGYSLDKSQKQMYNLEVKEPDPVEPGAMIPGITTGGTPFSFPSTFNFQSTVNNPILVTDMRSQSVEKGEDLEFYIIGKTNKREPLKATNYSVKYNGKTLKPVGDVEEVEQLNMKNKKKIYYKTKYKVTVNKVGNISCVLKVKDPKLKTETEAKYMIKGTKARPKVGNVAAVLDLTFIDVDSPTAEFVAKKGDTVQTAISKAIKETDYNISYQGGEIQSIAGLSISKSILGNYKSALGSKYVAPKGGVIKNGDLYKKGKWVIKSTAGKTLKPSDKITKSINIIVYYDLGIKISTVPTPGDVDNTQPGDDQNNDDKDDGGNGGGDVTPGADDKDDPAPPVDPSGPTDEDSGTSTNSLE